MVTFIIIIIGLLFAGAIVGMAIYSTSNKSNKAREPVDVLQLVGGTDAHKPAKKHEAGHSGHGDSHGHGHGGWSFSDGVIITLVILVAVPSVCVLWWFFASITSHPQVYVVPRQSTVTPAILPVVPDFPEIKDTDRTTCPTFTNDQATCDIAVTGSGYIFRKKGTPVTRHFCWEPDADPVATPAKERLKFKDIIALTSSGEKISYYDNPKPEHVVAYNFFPIKPLTLVYSMCEG
ncbi:hypothetical protein BH11PAT2_BH11PAT2_05690 [soil metagenome]